MGAPSSEAEARAMERHVNATPRLQEVTARMLQVIEALPAGERRTRYECLAGAIGVGLREGEDMSEREHGEWMTLLSDILAEPKGA